MEFRIPGSDTHVRIAERVKTVDDQYDIVDFGARHGDGSIDSIAVGGSLRTSSPWQPSLMSVEINATLKL